MRSPCARSSPVSGWRRLSSRPIPRTWRRFRTAASATSRPSSSTSPGPWPPSSRSTWSMLPGARRATFAICCGSTLRTCDKIRCARTGVGVLSGRFASGSKSARAQQKSETRDECGVTPQEIFKLVEAGLAQVERELARQATSNVELIDKIGHYVQDSGGKRIRPALLLLSSQMCGYDGPVCHRLGAVVELIHAATLVHDDIIDDAKVRRGRPSVNAQWGNEITVLMGDWLYMTSFHLALGERHFKILDILTEVTRKMIEGELIQLSLNGSMEVTEEQHLDISLRKTAFL